MTEQSEIEKKVYEKYPVTKKEKTCWQEKQRLAALRAEYKRRLENDEKGENTEA